MSKLPPDNLVYLQRRPFDFRCSTVVFPPDEVEALTESGNWLEALADGRILPVTEEQEHFLKVDRDEAEPATLLERAWLRLKGRREYEQQAVAEPLSRPVDYGIVDWDKDRCWW